MKSIFHNPVKHRVLYGVYIKKVYSMKPNRTRTDASRSKPRMNDDINTIYTILDNVHVCTVSYVKNGEPRALPTGYVRMDDLFYIHGSAKSHFFLQVQNVEIVCITAFLLDGIVLAKSGLNHSFNYRSVVLFGSPIVVNDKTEKNNILAAFMDRYIPGRWDEIRQPTPQELNATSVIGFKIDEVSAKIRQGPPNDLEKDKQLPVWSGVLPFETRLLQPIPDKNSIKKEVPTYIRSLYVSEDHDL